MKAYRIARIPAGRPWHNLTPPIRGGVYTKAAQPSIGSVNSDADVFTDDKLETSSSSSDSCGDDAEGDVTDQSSITTDCSDAEDVVKSTLRRRLIATADGSSTALPATADGKINMTRIEYADMLIANEAQASLNTYPSLDAETQADIVEKYRALHERVRNEGFYDCNYGAYGREICRYLFFGAASMTALYHGWFMTSAVFLGVFWVSCMLHAGHELPLLTPRLQHQIMFSAHDAGHCAITHHFETDSLIAIFIADFCCGLSMGWSVSHSSFRTPPQPFDTNRSASTGGSRVTMCTT